MSEEKTLAQVVAGASIGRYGDGELSIIRGGNCVSQVFDPRLASELRDVLNGRLHPRLDGGSHKFIVGVPTIDSRCPKLANWMKLVPRFEELLAPVAGTVYGSSFISRPDSAPWVDTPAYFDAVQSLWEGQRVILVANGRRGFSREFLLERGASFVDWVECPYRDAYESIGALFRACQQSPLQRVILACGPTATVLADRLAAAGKHAVDIGHLALYWRRYENPKAKSKPTTPGT